MVHTIALRLGQRSVSSIVTKVSIKKTQSFTIFHLRQVYKIHVYDWRHASFGYLVTVETRIRILVVFSFKYRECLGSGITLSAFLFCLFVSVLALTLYSSAPLSIHVPSFSDFSSSSIPIQLLFFYFPSFHSQFHFHSTLTSRLTSFINHETNPYSARLFIFLLFFIGSLPFPAVFQQISHPPIFSFTNTNSHAKFLTNTTSTQKKRPCHFLPSPQIHQQSSVEPSM